MERLVMTSGFMLLNSGLFSQITFKFLHKETNISSPISMTSRMAH